MTRMIVTITPPTPNGPLHIGHIAGPFMAADIFVRAQRQRGHECLFVSYSDDYQSYMLRRSHELGRDHRELAMENTNKIQAALRAMDISLDHWMRPWNNAFFADAVGEVYDHAKRSGAITSRRSPEPYCAACARWGYEAFGRGNCNFCGADSDASQCESCALEPDSTKMRNFRCKLCGQPHEWRPVQREFLVLEKFRDFLASLYARNTFRKPLDTWTAARVQSMLPEWGITRPEDAGLDLTPDGTRRIHTWFMGLSGYIGASREYAEEIGEPALFDAFWKAPDSLWVSFLGYDCAYSHMVVYPSLLSTMPQYTPEPVFYSNHFLQLDGENFSTSRNHAIWATELAQAACADSIRLYLCSIAPEESEANFRSADFHRWRQETYLQLVRGLSESGLRSAPVRPEVFSASQIMTVLSLHAAWSEAVSEKGFSLHKLSKVLNDIIGRLQAALHAGEETGHLALALAVFGQAVCPGLARQIYADFGIRPEDAGRLAMADAGFDYVI